MPIFEVQTDGGTFQIDAPDQNAALSALSSLPSAPENSIAGSAKALASGVADGVAGLAGMPGDIAELGARGIDRATQFVGEKLGIDVNKRVDLAPTYGMDAAKKSIESVTGELYQPQTNTEKFVHTIGFYAPAVIGGPGGAATKVMTRAVIPGVASEAAGQLAEGTGYEPVARIAGALGGAVAGSKLATAAVAPKVAAVPTQAENAALKSGYQGPATKALEINPTYAEKVANTATANLQRQKFSVKDPETATVYSLLNDLKKPEFGATHRMADFDNTRRRLNDIAGGTGSGAEAARQAIRTIDAATLRIPTSSVVAGDAKAASAELFNARKAAAVEFRDKKIAEVMEKASNTASATHSGANLENEIYKQVRTMLNNPRVHLRGWTADERAALRDVLPGVVAGGVRRVGKLAGGGGGLGQLASGAAGTAMFGPIGMVALPALGVGLNRLGAGLAQRRLSNVSDTLRARSPAYSKANQAARRAALSGGILRGLPKKEQIALQGLLATQFQNNARQ